MCCIHLAGSPSNPNWPSSSLLLWLQSDTLQTAQDAEIFLAARLAMLSSVLILSVAFDTVNHQSPLSVFTSHGITDTTEQQFDYYLAQRIVISHDHVCSMQSLHWCPTRLSAESYSIIPLLSVRSHSHHIKAHILRWPLNSSLPLFPQTVSLYLSMSSGHLVKKGS